MYNTDIKVNDGDKSVGDFEFDQVYIFQGISLPETTPFVL